MKATFSLDGRYLALLKKLQDVLKYFNVRIFKSKSFQKKKEILTLETIIENTMCTQL